MPNLLLVASRPAMDATGPATGTQPLPNNTTPSVPGWGGAGVGLTHPSPFTENASFCSKMAEIGPAVQPSPKMCVHSRVPTSSEEN